MKDEDEALISDELRPEYDESLLKNGVRGKYAQRYAAGANVVRLDPDVAKAFPSADAVNQALRLLMQLANTTVGTRQS